MRPLPPPRDRAHPALLAGVTRRALLVVAAVLALLAFSPRVLGAGAHEHGLGTAPDHTCAGCLAQQSPALEGEAAVTLDLPLAVLVDLAATSPSAVPARFSFAVRFACGPPA